MSWFKKRNEKLSRNERQTKLNLEQLECRELMASNLSLSSSLVFQPKMTTSTALMNTTSPTTTTSGSLIGGIDNPWDPTGQTEPEPYINLGARQIHIYGTNRSDRRDDVRIERSGDDLVVEMQVFDTSGNRTFQLTTIILNGFVDADSVWFMAEAGDDKFLNTTTKASFAYGGSGNDELIGGFGNDALSGGYGNDYILGRDGDDYLSGYYGQDLLDGGAGNDNLVGDVNGSISSNYLYGGDGDDDISGGKLGDYIDAGFGNDSVRGHDGDDTIYGSLGNDKINGGKGADLINGNDGNDSLFGDEDNDSIYGSFGNDLLYGGDGEDYLNGGYDADALFGGNGADYLNGGYGDDFLSGGYYSFTNSGGHDYSDVRDANSDRLWGGAGSDVMIRTDKILPYWYMDEVLDASSADTVVNIGYTGLLPFIDLDQFGHKYNGPLH